MVSASQNSSPQRCSVAGPPVTGVRGCPQGVRDEPSGGSGPAGSSVSHMRDESDRCSCGVALEGRPGGAYNEEAFRHFLALEGKRSEHSGRPFLLLLVDLKERPEVGARELLSALCRCVRETDFVGWYRERRVAGAVLTDLVDRSPAEVSRVVGERVSAALRAGLPSDVARRLQVRVYQHEPETPALWG